MTYHSSNYYWNEGIPYGLGRIENPSEEALPTYKVVMDPYRKHITIEKYFKNEFVNVIYDSSFLNFRHLKNEDHRAWQKTTISESPEKVVCHLRDQDDRLVFKETHFFNGNLCKECHVTSVHDIPISIQRMYYKQLGDSYNGVILFDHNEHPVVFKEYEFDDNLEEFTELLKTEWNMQHFNLIRL